MPLSWPAEILSPYDRRVSTEIREVWEEKFMVRKKGKNERYIVRVLGPGEREEIVEIETTKYTTILNNNLR